MYHFLQDLRKANSLKSQVDTYKKQVSEQFTVFIEYFFVLCFFSNIVNREYFFKQCILYFTFLSGSSVTGTSFRFAKTGRQGMYTVFKSTQSEHRT